jgi:hypothetical protein
LIVPAFDLAEPPSFYELDDGLTLQSGTTSMAAAAGGTHAARRRWRSERGFGYSSDSLSSYSMSLAVF